MWFGKKKKQPECNPTVPVCADVEYDEIITNLRIKNNRLQKRITHWEQAYLEQATLGYADTKTISNLRLLVDSRELETYKLMDIVHSLQEQLKKKKVRKKK